MAGMNELERVERLAANLSHGLPDVRLRAVQNLQFKLLSNVLGEGIYTSTSCMRNLAEGISSSLQLLLSSTTSSSNGDDNWLSPSSTQAKLLEELMQLTILIGGKSSLAPEAAAASFAALLEKLYVVHSKCEAGEGSVQRLVQQAIEAVCTIKPVTLTDISTSRLADHDPIPFDQLHRPYTASALKSASKGGAAEDKLQRGAGAILNSSLVYSGWRFGRVVLTDSDERHLFDLEVKIKLGHDTAVQLMWDAINDFPAPVLVARPSLISAVLDLVGSIFPQENSAGLGGLTPTLGMQWLEALISKAAKAFTVQIEGSLCSSVPVSSAPVVEAEDGTSDFGKPSLAAQMTRAMHALRYPVLDDASTNANQGAAAAGASLRVSPAPSLPGIAFAACAASLPLLQSRDPAVAAQVLSLLQTALPLVQEPAVAIASRGLDIIDRKRLQHLLNRSEQLLRFFDVLFSVDRVVRLCRTPATSSASGPASSPIHVPGRNSSLNAATSDLDVLETDPVHRLSQAAHEAVLLRCVVSILQAVPSEHVALASNELAASSLVGQSVSASATVPTGLSDKLELGPLTLSVVKDILASGGGSTDLLELGALGTDPDAASVERSLITLLKAADPAAEDGIQYAFELLQSVHSLRQMAESDANGRDAPATFLLDKLLQRAHAVCNLLDSGSESMIDEISEIGKTVPDIAVVLLAVAVSRCGDQCRELIARDRTVVSALSLVTRLASCCGGAVRNETYSSLLTLLSGGKNDGRSITTEQLYLLKVLKFQAPRQEQLVGALACPIFVHALVTFGLLGADGVDLSYGENVVVCGSEAAIPDAVALLDKLCMYLLTTAGLDAAIVSSWSMLLGPLKVCEWNGLGARAAANSRGTSLPHAVLSFITLLEDLCAGSAGGSKARTSYGLALVLGCYHATPAVRARCAGRLKYELVGLSIPSADIDGVDGRLNEAVLDPFSDAVNAAVKLSSWAELQTSSAPATSAGASSGYVSAVPSRLANHTEARKIASIAFGDHEASIRSAALRQLRQVLEDRNVMATAEAAWCVHTASCCVALVAEFNQSLQAAPAGARFGISSAGMNLEAYRLTLEAASLLRHLVYESLAVRGSCVFWPYDSAAPLDVSIFPLVGAALRIRSDGGSISGNTGANVRELDEIARQVQALCNQALAALVHDGARWSQALDASADANVNSLSVSYCTVSALSVCGSGGAARPEASKLSIPSFLSSTFAFPLARSAQDTERADLWPFEVVVMRCEVLPSDSAGDVPGKSRMRPLPSRHTMSLVVAAAFSAPSEETINALSNDICAMIATASGHKPLRSVLVSARALGSALPAILGGLASNDLRLALSRLLSVPPRSKNDFTTLVAALGLLEDVVHGCGKGREKGGEGAYTVLHSCSLLIEDTTLSLLGPLYPLIESFREATAGAAMAALRPDFTSRDHVMKDKDVEMTYARAAAQTSVLSLLEALCGVTYPLASFNSVQENGHSLPRFLAQMVAGELVPSWKRSQAAAILEALVTKHGVRAALSEPVNAESELDGLAYVSLSESANLGATGRKSSIASDSLCSLDLILRSVKLLRTPDVLRGNGALLSALRLLLIVSNQVAAAGSNSPASESSSATASEMTWWTLRRDWGWTLRLGWDRRAEVRVLTMSLLRNLVALGSASVGSSLAMTVDSLAGTGSFNQTAGQQWPPIDALLHVVLDVSESHATRAIALETLLICPSTEDDDDKSSRKDRTAQCFAACLDLIGQPASRFGRLQDKGCVAPSSMGAALRCMLQLLTPKRDGCVGTSSAVESAQLLTVHRALPAIMSLIQPSTRVLAEHSALVRVGIVEAGNEGLHAYEDSGSDSNKRYSLLGGWEGLWSAFVGSSNDAAVSLALSAACRVVSASARLPGMGNDANAGPSSDLLMQAARQTSLLRGLLALLANTDGLLQTVENSRGCIAADSRISAVGECLAVLLARGDKEGASSGGKEREALSAVLQSEPGLAGGVMRRMTIRLEQVLLALESISSPGSVTAGLSGSMRALCLLLDSAPFTALLAELDWTDSVGADPYEEDEEVLAERAAIAAAAAAHPSPVKSFSQALYRLRVALLGMDSGAGAKPNTSNASAASTTWGVLSTRLDVMIGLWTQRFSSSRAVMYSMTVGGEPAYPILDHYIETLAAAASDLTKASTPTVREVSIERAQRQQQSDMQRSLQSIKRRTRPNASMTASGELFSPMAGPGIAGSKWRVKARGYTWTKPPRHANAAASTSSNVTLWAALLALTGCAAHPAAARRCADLGLQQSLSTLLRLVSAGASVGDASPSSGEMASAVVAATCAFALGGDGAKKALCNAGASPCALTASTFGDSAGGRGGASMHTLHQLIALGLGTPSGNTSPTSSAASNDTRYALLALGASLLRGAGASTPTLQKAAVSQVLSLSLQRSLCTDADKEATPYLLDCLLACLVAEASTGLRDRSDARPDSLSARASGSNVIGSSGGLRDITNNARSGSSGRGGGGRAYSPVPSDGDFKPVPLPQLMQWIGESHSDRPEFLAAAVRFLGCLGAASLPASQDASSGEGTPSTLTGAHANPATKRLLSVACSPEALKLLVQALDADTTANAETLNSVASVALWILLHSSEVAKARIKEIVPTPLLPQLLAPAAGVASLGGKGHTLQQGQGRSVGFGREGARARTALLGLLQHNSA